MKNVESNKCHGELLEKIDFETVGAKKPYE